MVLIPSTTMMDCPARHLHGLEANNMILQRSREHPSCPDLSTKGQYGIITDERGSLVRASMAWELEAYTKSQCQPVHPQKVKPSHYIHCLCKGSIMKMQWCLPYGLAASGGVKCKLWIWEVYIQVSTWRH